MSRRCRPGIRARIVAGTNRGTIVVVVRNYFGEPLDGFEWPRARFAWVVTSLGAPLHSFYLDTGEPAPPARTGVVEDSDLEPLDDGDDWLEISSTLDRPVETLS